MPARFHPFFVPLFAATAFIPACDDPNVYTRSTPDDALNNAQKMIIEGDAERLVDLIHAEDFDQRALLNQLGSVLGALQDLAESVQRRFPAEVARFKLEAQQAAAENRTSSWSRWLIAANPAAGGSAFGLGRIDRSEFALQSDDEADTKPQRPGFAAPQISESQRQVFLNLAKQLFADPYGWLEDGRQKLTTIYVSDDTVAVLWDGKTIAPPIGLTLQDAGEGWQVVIPWHLPGIRTVKPQNRDEIMVFGSILKTFENLVVDLEREINNGSVRNMTELADTAVERAAMPALLVFYAYGNLVSEREKRQRPPSTNQPSPATQGTGP